MRRKVITVFFILTTISLLAQQKPQLVVPLAHTGYLSYMSYTPDDRNILTVSFDGTAKVWDKFSGRLITTIDSLSNHEDVVFTDNGTELLSFPGTFSDKPGNALRLWDAASGNLLKTFTGHRRKIIHTATSGNLAVSCAYDTTAVLWDLKSGKALLVMDSFNYVPGHALFSPNGKQFAIYTWQPNHTQWDNQVQLWDAEKKIKIANYNTSGGPIGKVQFSPDGTKLLIAMLWHSTGYVFDTHTGDLAYELAGHEGHLRYGVFFTPDGQKVVTSSKDQTIRIWDAKDGTPLKTIYAHEGDIDYVVLSPDGKYLASSSDEDKMVVKWDLATGHFLAKWETTEQIRGSLAFSAKGNYLFYQASNTSQSSLYMFDANNHTLVKKFKNITGYCIDASERYLCLKENNSFLPLMVHVQTVQPLYKLGTPAENYEKIRFATQTNKLLYNSGINTCRLWNLNNGDQEQLIRYNRHGVARALTVIENQTWMASTTHEEVYMWLDGEKRPQYKVMAGHYDVCHLIFSPTGKYFAVFGDCDMFYSDTVRIYETKTGKLRNTLSGVFFSNENSTFSHDEEKLITSGFMEPVYIWDIKTEKLDTVLYAGSNPYFSEDYDKREYENNNAAISPDKKWAATTYKNHDFLHIWDVEAKKPEGKYITDTTAWGSFITRMCFTDKGTFLAVNYYRSSDDINSPDYSKNYHDFVVVYRRGNTGPHIKIDGGKGFLLSPNEKYIAVEVDKEMRVYELATKKLVYAVPYNNGISGFIEWNADGTLLALQGQDGIFKVLNPAAMQLPINYNVEGKIKAIDWERNNLVAYQNSTLLLYQMNSGIHKVSIVMLGGRNATKVTREGYYQAMPEDARLLAWRYKGSLYDFSRWDMQYNRPDKVLQAFENPDTALVSLHRAAWQKRIRKTNTDTAKFNIAAQLPLAEILNAAEIEGIQTQYSVVLKIKATEKQKGITLQSVSVTINGCPIYGVGGIAVQSSDTALTLPLALSTGPNKIKVTCTNSMGIQSAGTSVYTVCTPADSIKPTLWYVGIGVTKYADARHNLRYAAKDVNDMAAAFAGRQGVKTLLLTDSMATLKNIIAIKQILLKQTRPNDRVVLSLSGHGVVDSAYDFYFAPHDMDFKNPAVSGLSYDKLVGLLDSIPARSKLVLMDACHSGEMDKESLIGIKEAENDSISATKSGIELLVDDSGDHLGMKNTFRLMQEMFAGYGENNGATIISAAAGTEFAFEGNNWKNGVFTYCVLKGLTEKLADEDADGKITISELQNYVADNVELLTKGRQRPTGRQTNFDNNWVIWE